MCNSVRHVKTRDVFVSIYCILYRFFSIKFKTQDYNKSMLVTYLNKVDFYSEEPECFFSVYLLSLY